jgi:hypothetical protein
MRRTIGDSWLIRQVWWNLEIDLALWIRASLGIVPEGSFLIPSASLVPEIAQSPEPIRDPGRFGAAWQAWWQGLVSGSRFDAPDPDSPYSPPHFSGLDRFPELQREVLRLWPEAREWNSVRKRAGVARRVSPSQRGRGVVSRVERSLGRPVANFKLELLFLPTADLDVIKIHSSRYLVPESLYGAEDWPSRLQDMLREIA